MKGDCVTAAAREVPCASGGSDAFTVLGPARSQDPCPAGTIEPMRPAIVVGRPSDVIRTNLA
ncbi:hypothetical protein I3F58_28745 [Streptomyces sp. MUM 203J]|uniref:hypothetical protein n=1 Tax=Streptomyces sp. MUM 203J TaxID=2791990 RepID=UPI001F034C15|nr:hypothetical protein [Streptomyces sp. MUM 203J]MCH0543464.1 hypothetical protein [Streptomyces sp. MUM 203J]